jgi:hypothetical protein
VAAFHIKPISILFVVTVVVGNVTVDDSKLAPQDIVLAAVPVIAICRHCPLVGVPLRLVVIDVMFTASAVMVKTSMLFVFIVGVAELVTVPTLGLSLPPARRNNSAFVTVEAATFPDELLTTTIDGVRLFLVIVDAAPTMPMLESMIKISVEP